MMMHGVNKAITWWNGRSFCNVCCLLPDLLSSVVSSPDLVRHPMPSILAGTNISLFQNAAAEWKCNAKRSVPGIQPSLKNVAVGYNYDNSTSWRR
jgi:hypothetical protein